MQTYKLFPENSVKMDETLINIVNDLYKERKKYKIHLHKERKKYQQQLVFDKMKKIKKKTRIDKITNILSEE